MLLSFRSIHQSSKMVFRKPGKWKKKGTKPDTRKHIDYEEIPLNNDIMKKYYQAQHIMPSDDEFDTFYASLKTPLPSTFRITGTKNNAFQIRNFIQNNHVAKMQNVVVDGIKYDPPSAITWYPHQLCYQITCPRKVLRNSPEYTTLQKFLVAENETGNITRQELVSMVPPLLMDIQPGQMILDMCAAPGSKTGQIVEYISRQGGDDLPVGLVVANDADYKRSQLLVHQLKRFQSPCFMATNHDAAHFPNIPIMENGVMKPWQFDRVLCDVPCSGDGTLRKNPKVWHEWSQGAAIGLHSVQVQIFLRGAQLVKMGGRIVYSTCSFNPVENEAVVAEVLRLSKGALELKDVSDQLPGLIRRPGLVTWKVMTRDNQFITSMDDIENARARRKFPKSAFPPENADSLHLERCLRIYPHDQNTGGFFVAVFEKVKPMTLADQLTLKADDDVKETDLQAAEKEEEALIDSVTEAIANLPTEEYTPKPLAEPTTSKDVYGKKEAPFDLMSPDNPDLSEIQSFYGVDPVFPRDQFLLRSGVDTKNRQVYFISKSIQTVLASPRIKRLHIVNTGVRLFSRQGSLADTTQCAFRISSEGAALIQPYLQPHRSVSIELDDLETLLVRAFPRFESFSTKTRAQLESLATGGILFVVDVSKANLPADTKMLLSVWRGKTSVNVLLNKHDKKSLCQRLFGVLPEPIPVKNNKAAIDQ
ncbi:S-adenosyl-L-methionine-dependent methyltransferase [Chlamydoabsidia padenii]|nr:S-adenosyl-L-methionine-dependent methyltransferase [Chlamydoabsidia padenii]